MSLYNDSLNHIFSSEDMIQKRTAMDLLEKESELIMERERQESQQRFFINLILFMGLIIIILIVFFFLKRRDNLLLHKQQRIIDDKNKELAQVNNDLQATNEELTAANETIASHNQTLEKEVELRTKELIAYSNQLEQFTFMAAHNLRGPVARLTGLGNLLKMGIDEKEKKDVIDRIMNNTREIDHVLNDLNEILEIKSGVSRLISEVDLMKSLEHARTILKEDIEQAQAELEVDFKVKRVSAVKAYIESIFYNLISNALKYRSPARKLKLKISSSYKEGHIRLSFSDNGIGIDMQKYGEEIFSIYKRFHSHKDGRGMGLFLVKSQINILGGEIHIESEVDKGTTFHIDFQKEFKPVILENEL
jgi:signal transduction histidine kinase